jgi:hypothetical protein
MVGSMDVDPEIMTVAIVYIEKAPGSSTEETMSLQSSHGFADSTAQILGSL